MPGETVPNDLLFFITSQPHPIFVRQGQNLLMKHRLTLVQALTQYKHQFTHLDGRVIEYTYSGIVRPADKLVIDDEGMKSDGTNGHMIIECSIEFPSKLSEDEKKQLVQILGPPPTLSPALVHDRYEAELLTGSASVSVDEGYEDRVHAQVQSQVADGCKAQ